MHSLVQLTSPTLPLPQVTHNSAVYIFHARNRARLLATDHDSPDVIAQDVRRIIEDHS